MQIAVNIKNDSIAEKVLWMLEHFKNDGVEILKLSAKNEKEVLGNFKEGLKEVKAIRDGTLKSRPVADLLNEL